MTDRCPHCGKHNPLHEHLPDPELVPEPGDWSICIGCGQFGVFTKSGAVRKPTKAEQAELESDVEAQLMRHTWLEMNH